MWQMCHLVTVYGTNLIDMSLHPTCAQYMTLGSMYVCPYTLFPLCVGRWQREIWDELEGPFRFEVQSVEQDLILCMWHLVLSSVSVDWCFIDPYVYSFLDGPGKVVWFLNYNSEIFHTGFMTSGVSMFIKEGRGSEVFFLSFPKGPCTLTNILLTTLHSVTFIPVNHSNFCVMVSVFSGTPGGYCVNSFKEDLNTHLTTYVSKTFS